MPLLRILSAAVAIWFPFALANPDKNLGGEVGDLGYALQYLGICSFDLSPIRRLGPVGLFQPGSIRGAD